MVGKSERVTNVGHGQKKERGESLKKKGGCVSADRIPSPAGRRVEGKGL